jgi:hypothetical protein
MAQPVWTLSVDLQTKTATFQSGLADAAKSARGAFTDIKSGANEMGESTGVSMMEARHGVMLLGEEFGIHLPRALTTFIASIGPVGAAMEAAFPFLAIAVGATLLIEALVKIHESGEKLTEDQIHFGTAVQNAFNQLDQKIIQAQIRSDELRNDHLGALQKQLELIDKQSMDELVHSFEEVAKAADVVFGDLKSHWYTFGIGATGAKHALDQFQTQYDSLLAQGKDDDASGLLAGTLRRAQRILEMQKLAKANDGSLLSAPGENADIGKAMAAENELRAAGVGFTDKEVAAQEALVQALTAQVGIEGKISELKKLDKANAGTAEGNQAAAQNAEMARNAAESMLRMGEASIAADKAQAAARLAIARASIQERIQSDIDFADRELAVKQAANEAEIAALDKSGRDYTSQLKALQDKALELTQEHETEVAEIQARGQTELAEKALADLQQTERDKIEATRQGSAERLAAIDAAIREEQARNLQDTSFYRELMGQRVEAARQAAEEQAKLAEEASIKEAESELKSGELTLAALREQIAVKDSTRRVSEQQRIAEDTDFANAEYALQMKYFAQEIAALDKNDKDYLNKLKQFQDEEKQLTQQHENDLASIREKAEIQTNDKIAGYMQKFSQQISGSLTQLIMGHQSFGKTVEQIGNEMVSHVIQNTLQYVMSNKVRQNSDASAAASAAYKDGTAIGGPLGIVLGPIFAAAAFAGVMALEGGTDRVPGIGVGDIVPAMLTPGEGVVPGGVMDGLSKIARNGGFDSSPRYHVTTHVHMHASALDSDGMDEVLKKHAGTLQKHFEGTLRRMNR